MYPSAVMLKISNKHILQFVTKSFLFVATNIVINTLKFIPIALTIITYQYSALNYLLLQMNTRKLQSGCTGQPRLVNPERFRSQHSAPTLRFPRQSMAIDTYFTFSSNEFTHKHQMTHLAEINTSFSQRFPRENT